MKLFILLLACFAAANASSYYYNQKVYTYTYYCQHQFHVLPPTRCYHYSIYFPSIWCRSSHYSTILKAYPGDDCKERSVSDIITEVSNLLKAQRSRMCREMYARRTSYFCKIDYIHREFKRWFKSYLYRWYTYRYSYCGYVTISYYSVRDGRVTKYCQSLDAVRRDLWNKYNSAISAKITLLNTYHARIVKAVSDCLNTRIAKIAAYKKALESKINSYYRKFYTLHCTLAQKNRDHYRAVLKGLFYRFTGNWWVQWKAYVAVSYYYSRQKSHVYYLARAYLSKLNSFKYRLIAYYTCAYKCYLTNGCLSFASRSYYTHCKSLGRWYCYKSSYCYNRFCLAPFKVKFTACHYRTLKTCDVNAAAGDISGLISSLEKQRDDTLRTNESKYRSWRTTWIRNFLRYKAEFWRIVIIRHNFLCAWRRRTYIFTCGYISSVQTAYLAQMKRDLIIRASQQCASYYRQLITNLSNAQKAHNKNQQKYRDFFNSFISQLKAKFEACKSTRTTKIAEYKKKLEDSRNAQRKALGAAMYKAKNVHWRKFHDMLRSYHGSCYYKYTYIRWMYECYASHLIGVCNEVYGQFDSFWRRMIPRLVQHYACCYKCSINAKVSARYTCAYFYSWKYCLPTHATYTYQYACFYKYYHCL